MSRYLCSCCGTCQLDWNKWCTAQKKENEKITYGTELSEKNIIDTFSDELYENPHCGYRYCVFSLWSMLKNNINTRSFEIDNELDLKKQEIFYSKKNKQL